jgi:hypothetical protein
MTGVVLALAGLACGDGGPGMGAAREAVAVELASGEWEVEFAYPLFPLERDAEVRGGKFRFRPTGVGVPFTVVTDCFGKTKVTWARVPLHTIYKRDGNRLILAVAMLAGMWPTGFTPDRKTAVLVLRPAAPQKP